jgi:hypothetical protein
MLLAKSIGRVVLLKGDCLLELHVHQQAINSFFSVPVLCWNSTH